MTDATMGLLPNGERAKCRSVVQFDPHFPDRILLRATGQEIYAIAILLRVSIVDAAQLFRILPYEVEMISGTQLRSTNTPQLPSGSFFSFSLD